MGHLTYQNDKGLEAYFLIHNGLKAMGNNSVTITHTAKLLESLEKEIEAKRGKKLLLDMARILREYAGT